MAGASEVAVAPRAELSESLFAKLSPGPGKPATEVADHQRARIHGAMLEIVAERGYGAVTVRELVRLAGVSTRAFYELYSGKEECFFCTHKLIVRRVVKRIVASQAGERDWRERLRLTFAAFADELKRDPQAARLLLVEAYAAGPASLERARRAECTFETRIAECFDSAADGIEMSAQLVTGIVAGMVCVARAHLLADGGGEPSQLSDGLTEWALSFYSESASEIAELDRQCAREELTANQLQTPSSNSGERARAPSDDRALILSAVAKLAAGQGYDSLTVRRIRVAAGTPQRSFAANFDGVEDCFIEALEQQARRALSEATHAQASGGTWAGGIFLAIDAVCAQVATDPIFANLCFSQVCAAGAGGIDCRERLIADIVKHIRVTSPRGARPDELAVEASVGAAWGVLRQRVASGHACQAQHIAMTLAYLLLAPMIDAQTAVSAIREELGIGRAPRRLSPAT